MERASFFQFERNIFKISLLLTVALVSVYGSQGIHLDRTFLAAYNRTLQYFTFWEKQFNSPVRCVSYCHADRNCLSVNYRKTSHLCQLNNATRTQSPDDFIADYDSIYYDADVDTPLWPLPVNELRRSCKDLLEAGNNVSGIYTIYPPAYNGGGVVVYCDMVTGGGGWIVIQRRYDGSCEFYQYWSYYQDGFGDGPENEFWLGNDILRALTETGATWQLRVDVADWDDKTAFAEYDSFWVSGDKYMLHIDLYNSAISTAGDSLMFLNGSYFSTKDVNNYIDADLQCAKDNHWGGWWYRNGSGSNLNGKYSSSQVASDRFQNGIVWHSWKGYDYSLRNCTIKIRPLEKEH